MKKRIQFLDNLRTFLVFIVVLYHAQFPYIHTLETIWIVSDPVKNDLIGLVGMYLDLFVMFGLFFIAGFFAPMSLERKSVKEFVLSKLKRIMLPWTMAVLTLIPLYKAIYLFSRGKPQEEWFSYFHWFERFGGNPYLFSDNPSQNWLWFLPVLFLFQMIYAVLYQNKTIIRNYLTVKTGALAILIVGIISSMTISVFGFTGWHDSLLFHFQRERLLTYFMIFLLGALCYNQNVFQSGERNMKRFVWSNIGLSFILIIYTVVALNLLFNMASPDRNYFFISGTVDLIIYYGLQLSSMLTFLYILVDYFRYKFNKTGPWIDRLNRNSYYVYLIHMVVSGGIAAWMLDISISVGIKYVLLAAATFIVSNLIVSILTLRFSKNHFTQTQNR